MRKMTNNNEEKNYGISKTLIVFDGVFVLLIMIMIFAIYSSSNVQVVKEVPKPGKISINPFDSLKLEARAAYVFDVSKNEAIFKKNEFAQLPLASVTKLMMALTATDLLPEDSKITIRNEFIQEEGDSGLFVNESWRLKDLLDFSLLVSSNDGARSIASVVGAFDIKSEDYNLGRKDFIMKMNDRAQILGLKEMYFTNESGLDEGSVSGGYGSAIDVEKLMQYILQNKPEILETTKYESVDINSLSRKHTAKNTNIVADQIPGLLASKTGYTDLAGGNLAVAFDSSIGRPIIVVVLGSSLDGRFEDVNKLVKASLEYIGE